MPYIIGTEEYKRHPYAGVVFMGEDELEQMDLHQEEVEQLLEDKKMEEALLQRNAEDMAKIDEYQNQQEQVMMV